MNANELAQLEDPDLYAAELQHWLMTEGPRSPWVRQLMRVARRHPDAELDRIFETKLAEYKRAMREERVPTLWNLPVRALEWLTDNARFTPPREVLMTLVYVVLVLVAFEGLKSRLPRWDRLLEPAEVPTAARLFSRDNGALASYRVPAPVDVRERVDEWFATELSRAAQSDSFRQAVAEQVSRVLMAPTYEEGNGSDSAAPGDMLRQLVREQLRAAVGELEQPVGEAVAAARPGERAVAEIRDALAQADLAAQTAAAVKNVVADQKLPDLIARELSAKIKELDVKQIVRKAVTDGLADADVSEKIAVLLRQSLESEEWRKQVQGAINTAGGTAEAQAAFQQKVQAWFDSDAFRKSLSKAVLQALAAGKGAAPQTEPNAETVSATDAKGDGG